MRKVLTSFGKGIIILFILLWPLKASSQGATHLIGNTTPAIAIGSNVLYDATTSMNLGIEFKIAKDFTLKLPAVYNPWTFEHYKKVKFIFVQPEIRWWLCEPFSAHFIGLHGHYAFYNMGGIGSEYLKNYRYQGYLYGGGFSYGYHFYLSPRWILETTIGAGYARMVYDKYKCETCGDYVGEENYDYIGLTNLGISVIYILK